MADIIDIVFLVDNTSSMSSYIDQVKNNVNSFANSLNGSGIDYRLGLVEFGDIYDSSIKKYEFTSDIETFVADVNAIDLTGGYDLPESGLEALVDSTNGALSMDFRPEAGKRFIIVTDADFHNQGESGNGDSGAYLVTDDVLNQLLANNVFMDVVGTIYSSKPEWEPLANATGGQFYDIKGDFPSLFQSIVDEIVEQDTDFVTVDLNKVGENQTGLFIVNQVTAEDGTTSINPDAVFAPNALNYNNHIYAVYSNVNTTWNDAKTYCENLGGHLVTITDEAEQAAVQNLLQNEENPVNSYWMGGYTESEVATEGWQWTSGETIPAGEAVNAEGANYSNWGYAQPDGDGNNLMMYYGENYYSTLGQWNDFPASGENGQEFFGTANIGLICEWDNAEVVGEVTEANIYTAAENTEYSQNITITENWDVTATANNDILNITADGVTAEGGEGSDRFAVSSGVNDVVFADFTPADDSLSFADTIPEESLHESYSSGELMLSNDDINLTFQNMAGLTEELLNEEVNNGGVTNTVEQLIESVPYVTVNQDAPVMMSLSHWSYGFYPPTE